MNVEELKDAIREAFPDTNVINSFKRFGFIVGELSHAYINIFKEVCFYVTENERFSDKAKYFFAFVIPIAAILLLSWI